MLDYEANWVNHVYSREADQGSAEPACSNAALQKQILSAWIASQKLIISNALYHGRGMCIQMPTSSTATVDFADLYFSKFYAPILHSALLFFIRTLKVGILQFKSKTLENYIYRLSIYKVGFLYYIGCGIVYIKSRVTVLHRICRPINSSSYLPEWLRSEPWDEIADSDRTGLSLLGPLH